MCRYEAAQKILIQALPFLRTWGSAIRFIYNPGKYTLIHIRTYIYIYIYIYIIIHVHANIFILIHIIKNTYILTHIHMQTVPVRFFNTKTKIK